MSIFGGDFMRNFSPLQSLIARAVDPYKHEPDYAAHLEVAEYINNKKANTYVPLTYPTWMPRQICFQASRGCNDDSPDR